MPAVKLLLNRRKKRTSSQLTGRETNQPATAVATAAAMGPAQSAFSNGMAGKGCRSNAFVSCGPRNSQPSQPKTSGNAKRGKGGSLCLSRGFRSNAVSAGLSVSELKAEIIVLTAIVSANCRKNWPVIPEINAHGTNTALSTRPTAITG